MMENSSAKTVRPSVDSEGTISAVSMIVALAKSGVPLESIALLKTLTEEERAQVQKALA